MDILYLIWLNGQKNIGSARMASLIEHFGTAQNVYENRDISEYMKIDGIGMDTAINLIQNKDLTEAGRILEFVDKKHIGLITYQSEKYPRKLKEIYGAPPILYYKGTNIFTSDTPSIAIVGSRKATPYGLKAAAELSKELSQCGINIISGLAAGIDAAAHSACINSGGITGAVLGCGIDVVYPASNKELYLKIEHSGGMILTEFSPGTSSISTNFPQRNRIISGICDGVIVVEAARSSGSLITANYALEQGRDVYAVPGNINSPQSEGTNSLIRQGARLVTSGKDVIEDMYELLRGMYPSEQKKNELPELDKDQSAVYNAISSGNNTVNAVSKCLNMPIGTVMGIVSTLEIEGIIASDMGTLYIL
ncbi:MAG: DNA-protecting protein DprA [Anaerofustis stercorihominis]|nr:DNA-protecting protein DprA [Anaerofustis stercorihominis]